MDYIYITLVVGKNNIDLKVPAHVKIEELLKMISEIYGFSVSASNRFQAEPVGRILNNASTLSQENLSNGAMLTII